MPFSGILVWYAYFNKNVTFIWLIMCNRSPWHRVINYNHISSDLCLLFAFWYNELSWNSVNQTSKWQMKTNNTYFSSFARWLYIPVGSESFKSNISPSGIGRGHLFCIVYHTFLYCCQQGSFILCIKMSQPNT